jgi:hypothetical protein
MISAFDDKLLEGMITCGTAKLPVIIPFPVEFNVLPDIVPDAIIPSVVFIKPDAFIVPVLIEPEVATPDEVIVVLVILSKVELVAVKFVDTTAVLALKLVGLNVVVFRLVKFPVVAVTLSEFTFVSLKFPFPST